MLLIWLVLGCVGGTVLCCLLFGLRFGGGLVLIVLDECFYGWWCVCWYMLPPWVSYSGFLRICLFWMLACWVVCVLIVFLFVVLFGVYV